MRTTLRTSSTALVVFIAAATGLAEQQRLPTGNWKSASPVTFTGPALTGAEMYLSIDVAEDGSFRGVWSPYHCTAVEPLRSGPARPPR